MTLGQSQVIWREVRRRGRKKRYGVTNREGEIKIDDSYRGAEYGY
jgi:hypothetical protein